MAGDWLKVEKATPRKPEVLRIAVALGVRPDEAFGLCFRFWSWCDDQLIEGNAAGVSGELVDALVERSGFASALIDVGWLQVRSGSLVIPHFDRHLSESAKKRALTAKRVAKHSTKKTNADNVSGALAEKRREETKNSSHSRARDGTDENLGFLEGFDEQFLTWWNTLPMGMRSGQQAVWKRWPNVLVEIQINHNFTKDEAISHLIERTKAFTASPRGQSSKYRWKPLTFLDEGHYDDAPEAWEEPDGGDRKNTGKPRTAKALREAARRADVRNLEEELFGETGIFPTTAPGI